MVSIYGIPFFFFRVCLKVFRFSGLCKMIKYWNCCFCFIRPHVCQVKRHQENWWRLIKFDRRERKPYIFRQPRAEMKEIDKLFNQSFLNAPRATLQWSYPLTLVTTNTDKESIQSFPTLQLNFFASGSEVKIAINQFEVNYFKAMLTVLGLFCAYILHLYLLFFNFFFSSFCLKIGYKISIILINRK